MLVSSDELFLPEIDEEVYVQQIKLDFLEEYKTEIQCSGVITTNYYRFCEVVSEKTSYLNGQLRLFEYPELLEVADFKCQKANKENKKDGNGQTNVNVARYPKRN